jgi:hypothetical protein
VTRGALISAGDRIELWLLLPFLLLFFLFNFLRYLRFLPPLFFRHSLPFPHHTFLLFFFLYLLLLLHCLLFCVFLFLLFLLFFSILLVVWSFCVRTNVFSGYDMKIAQLIFQFSSFSFFFSSSQSVFPCATRVRLSINPHSTLVSVETVPRPVSVFIARAPHATRDASWNHMPL